MAIIRTERSLLLYEVESTWGSMVQPTTRFGIVDSANLPDPDFGWRPFNGIGSGRNRDTILRGVQTLRGSVPDIVLQHSSTSSANTAKLLSLLLGRNSSGTVLEGLSITDERLPSFTMQAAYRDTSGIYRLVRNYLGGKVNRASLSASEGQELRLNLEEVIFKEVHHNDALAEGFDPSVVVSTDPGLTDATRYIFAGGRLSINGVNVARTRRFNLSIDNQVEPRYYIAPTSTLVPYWQVPNDLIENKRSYRLEVEIEIGDPTTDFRFYEFLLRQGASTVGGKTVGAPIVLALTPESGGGLINIVCSPAASTIHPGAVLQQARHSIPAPPTGMVSVNLSFDLDSCAIVIT